MPLPVPAPRTWSVNDLASGALLNTNIRDGINYLANPPLFRAAQTVVQGIPTGSGSWSGISFDQTIYDTYNGHTTNTRYTAQVPGYYQLMGQIRWAPGGTGDRGVAIGVNSSTALVDSIRFVTPSSGGTTVMTVCTVFLNVGDFAAVLGSQSSGSTFNTAISGNGEPSFEARWVHA